MIDSIRGNTMCKFLVKVVSKDSKENILNDQSSVYSPPRKSNRLKKMQKLKERLYKTYGQKIKIKEEDSSVKQYEDIM